jgi:hypothetical protein
MKKNHVLQMRKSHVETVVKKLADAVLLKNRKH